MKFNNSKLMIYLSWEFCLVWFYARCVIMQRLCKIMQEVWIYDSYARYFILAGLKNIITFSFALLFSFILRISPKGNKNFFTTTNFVTCWRKIYPLLCKRIAVLWDFFFTIHGKTNIHIIKITSIEFISKRISKELIK